MEPMTCTHAEELLDLYAAGECDPVTAAAIEQHHAGCPACAAAEREARRVQALLISTTRRPPGWPVSRRGSTKKTASYANRGACRLLRASWQRRPRWSS